MGLYEMVYIMTCRVGRNAQAKCMTEIAQEVLNRGGVIRSLKNEGIVDLQFPMMRWGVKHLRGRYVTMVFDASGSALEEVMDNIKNGRTEVFRCLVLNRTGKIGHRIYGGLLVDPSEADIGMNLEADLPSFILQPSTKKDDATFEDELKGMRLFDDEPEAPKAKPRRASLEDEFLEGLDPLDDRD
eukprot:TRINITY_DN785_c0_g1_i1.p1 TRINITY_DN785_c0_g1~~TRINITY_DN785_c0_g1_i1.p1  ORF type:complete len:205 (+),score=55.02 TRINITY_DN785_c0_g1_i1:63-617(+)